VLDPVAHPGFGRDQMVHVQDRPRATLQGLVHPDDRSVRSTKDSCVEHTRPVGTREEPGLHDDDAARAEVSREPRHGPSQIALAPNVADRREQAGHGIEGPSEVEGLHPRADEPDAGQLLTRSPEHPGVRIDPGDLEPALEMYEVIPGSARHVEQRPGVRSSEPSNEVGDLTRLLCVVLPGVDRVVVRGGLAVRREGPTGRRHAARSRLLRARTAATGSLIIVGVAAPLATSVRAGTAAVPGAAGRPASAAATAAPAPAVSARAPAPVPGRAAPTAAREVVPARRQGEPVAAGGTFPRQLAVLIGCERQRCPALSARAGVRRPAPLAVAAPVPAAVSSISELPSGRALVRDLGLGTLRNELRHRLTLRASHFERAVRRGLDGKSTTAFRALEALGGRRDTALGSLRRTPGAERNGPLQQGRDLVA
jgi:hypothetical protein